MIPKIKLWDLVKYFFTKNKYGVEIKDYTLGMMIFIGIMYWIKFKTGLY